MNAHLRCAGIAMMLGGLFASSHARAATVALNPSEFNTLFQATDPAQQTSAGASQYIFAGLTDDLSIRRGLLSFDLTSIPANAQVTSASLTLWFDKSKSGVNYSASIYKMTTLWGEGTSPTSVTQGGGGGNGSPATQDDATWLYTFYNASNPSASPTWSNPGGDGNYISTASATTVIHGQQGTLTPYSWSGAGVVADVQSWITNPLGNDGWMLKGDESQSVATTMRFQSGDTPDDGTNNTIDAMPVLTITYSTPEPGAIGFALLSAIAVLSRRSRRHT